MILKVKHHHPIISISLLIISAIALYLLVTDVQYLITGEKNYLGRGVTFEWQALIVGFWAIWIIGSLNLLFNKRISFIFLFPVSLMSLVAIVISLKQVFYEDLQTQLFYFIAMTLTTIILIYINLKKVRSSLNISKAHYLYGSLILILFVTLFLTIDKY